jgi:hypothetical protein
VTSIPIARQRLCKHIPARANMPKNRTSIAKQRIRKHTSLTIGAVLDEVTKHGSSPEMKNRVSRRQPAGIWTWEQRNWIESSLRDWQLQNNGTKGIRLWKEDFMCNLKWQWDFFYKSVDRILLVKTEKLSACVTLNWKVCIIAIEL